jgi:hypothetical protein
VDATDWTANHLELRPAYAAFDANRNAQSVLAIRMLQSTTAKLADTTKINCASLGAGTANSQQTKQDGVGVTNNALWERVSSLARWRGTVAGCLADGVVSRGSCSGNSL